MSKIRNMLLVAVILISTAATAQTKSIAAHQYWIDGNLEASVSSGTKPTTIDISKLKPGLHSLTARVKDNKGAWSSQVARYFIVPQTLANATNIVTREYWIDGKIASKTTLGASVAEIDIKSLKPGIHSLTTRVKDNMGQWSCQVARYFIVPQTFVTATKITAKEYWIDGEIAAKTTLGESVAEIDISKLKPGLHSLTTRVKDNTGLWSSQVARYFIIPQTFVTATKITAKEYWIDGEIAAKTTLPESIAEIDISKLKPGLHSLTTRVKDNTGLWSSQVARYFIIPQVSEKATKITAKEYWIDGEIAAKTTLPESVAEIDISKLKPGLHLLTTRIKDNNGLWSTQVARYFVVDDNAAVAETNITQYMYWFDDDQDNILTGKLSSASGIIDIDISEVEAGEHTLWWSCGNERGKWSKPLSATFNSKSFYTFTVPETGFATFSADVNIALPDGLTAHFCTNMKETDEGLAIKVEEIEGQVVASNTGVIINGTPGESYKLRYTAEEATATEGNMLAPVVDSTYVDAISDEYTNFMLKDSMFVSIGEESATIKMPANTAYLPTLTTAAGETKSIILIWKDEEATGIMRIEGEENKNVQDGSIYSISGQRLSAPRKGINIINGRKVVIK